MRFSGCALEDEDPPAAMCARMQGSLFSAKEGANLRRIWEIFDRLKGRRFEFRVSSILASVSRVKNGRRVHNTTINILRDVPSFYEDEAPTASALDASWW